MDFLTIRMLDFSKPFIASPPLRKGGDNSSVVRRLVMRKGYSYRGNPLTCSLPCAAGEGWGGGTFKLLPNTIPSPRRI